MIRPSMYLKLETHLFKICCFIFRKAYREDIDIMNFDGNPDPARQKVLKELNLINYLCELLNRPFERGIFEMSLLKENHAITRVLSITYITIKYIIMENRVNELYCSQ